jgi:hypothetical protein
VSTVEGAHTRGEHDVAWNNSGLPDLALSFEDDGAFDDAGIVRALEAYGFRRLRGKAAPTE